MTTKYRQLFIIEGKLLGETPRDRIFEGNNVSEPESGMWYCEHCGDVYAKTPVMRPEGSITKWQAFRRVCRKCEKPALNRDVPGSVWSGWDKAYSAALPEAVLRRELLLHIDFYERNSK